MKIGILTYFGDLNAGTNLQAYATLKAVQKVFKGHEVEIINFQTWRRLNVPYLSHANIFTIKNDLIRIRKYYHFVKTYLNLSEQKLISSDYNEGIKFITTENYDIILVGSDTLLELIRVREGITPYWLSPNIKAKKYLLAASARNLTYDKLNVVQVELIQATINDFSLLGVRDMATYRLLSQFVNKNDERLQIVPDPTFTLAIDYKFAEKYIKKMNINFNVPTVCLHLCKDDYWATDLADRLRVKGYQIASLRPARYADFVLNDLSPFEQIGIYRYFSLMITHRFHDTIFCLKNGTPMITYPFNDSYTTNFGDSKYYNLLKDFDLEETNYISKKSEITVDLIMSKLENAINNFKSKKLIIDFLLTANTIKYYKFLSSVRDLSL